MSFIIDPLIGILEA